VSARLRLRGDGSTEAFHIAALTALVLTTGAVVLGVRDLLFAMLIFADEAPVVTWSRMFVFIFLPLLGWMMLAVRRPLMALGAAAPPLLGAMAAFIAWIVLH